MSYEPRIIIRKKHLDKHIAKLEEEQWHKKEEKANVAKFLLDVSNSNVIKFDDLELLMCQPELTSFNNAVRRKLDILKVDYRTDW